MKRIAELFAVCCVVFFFAGCRQPSVTPDDVDVLNDVGLISVEMYHTGGNDIRFWRVREMPGRSTLVVQEGVLGVSTRSYELFEQTQEDLERVAKEQVAEKLNEGYKVYGPEAYSQLILQIELSEWGDPDDIEKLIMVEELLNEYMLNSGNGKCLGSDAGAKISFFITAFSAEIAVNTILEMFSKEGYHYNPVIILEKGSEVQVLHPENFQGDISLI